MKLLVYGDIGGSGGYIRYCKGLFGSNMIPKDMQVWFVCSLSLYEKLKPLDSHIKVITHPWILSDKRYQRYLWHLWVYPRLVRKIKPDIEFYPSGQLRVYLRKACTITTCHNLLLFDKKELDRLDDQQEYQYFMQSRKRQADSFRKSEGTIFLSDYSQTMVCSEVPGIKNTSIIAHGLDRDFLIPEKRSYEFSGPVKLLYVSPYFHYKHQIEVVQAVQILRRETGLDFHLKLIGGGTSSYSKKLRSYIESVNSEQFVTIKDKVEYADLLREYAMSDIFIFASSCETFGITLLEAMGARLPVACSNQTGLSGILKDAGVYFDPDKPESIALAIKEISDNMTLRQALGEKAYTYALPYTWEQCATETFKYISEIEKITTKN